MKPNQAARILARTAAISAFALAVTAAAPASAALVEFKEVTGAWSNSQGTNASYSGNGTDEAKARWGTSTGQGRSGYNFLGTDSQVNVVAPGSSGSFVIGTFEHVNYPVTGGSISGIDLLFTAEVWVDGINLGPRTFTYNFTHDETDNDANPCAYGGSGNPINSAGCADRVQMNFNASSETFLIGLDQYTLDIAGFLVNNSPTTGFLTKEGKVNTAYIQGNVNLFSRAVGGGVPEPATWAMMIVGFGATGVMVRNNRRRLLANT
jgi:hypothetical protein